LIKKGGGTSPPLLFIFYQKKHITTMAHNINRHEITGKDAFFSVQEKAWHGLGQIVQDYPTSKEAIVFAGLDFEVEKRPLFTNMAPDTAADILIKKQFATVRTDTNQPLGIVGSKYNIVQNVQAFEFFDAIVGDDTGILYETAGALGDGERIFITAKLPDYIQVGRKDLIEQYVFLTTSHDGSGSIMAAFTPVRIVCNNTLNMALRSNSNAVTIKHTANATERLREAHKVMGICNTLGQQMETIFNKWSRERITDPELKKMIALAMAPNAEVFTAVAENKTGYDFSSNFENVCGQVFEYAMTADSQQLDTTHGTIFGAYNAITGYYQNVKGYSSHAQKLDSIMFGTGLDRTKKAFDLCMNARQFLS
jgi:phage/plasmid-like protein (TIGR03299 family)